METIENGKRIKLLGDPHLGRSFIHGVPLHRRGDRERMVWQDFLDALHGPAARVDYHICLGDLFDKWIVPYDLILDTADEYRKAAKANPGVGFFILKGNHDWTRDLTRRSAFDVFTALVADVPNIQVITQPFWLHGDIILYPWHPLWDASEKLSKIDGKILFGHFDTEFGDHNMVPTKLHFERIYTGHIHKPDRFTRDGTEVVVVGSLQPYAHGEEVNDDLYVTLTPDQIGGELRNKCVRILGTYEGDIDCLQLTFKREANASDDDQLETVTMGDFDVEKIFKESFEEAGVSPERTAEVLDQYHEKRNANAA